MEIWSDKIVKRLYYGSLTETERNGLAIAVEILRDIYPDIDIYESILGGGSAISIGKKLINQSKGRPLFVITKPRRGKDSCVKLRIDSKKDRENIAKSLKCSWSDLSEIRFELKDFHRVSDDFEAFLKKIKISVSFIGERSAGHGYNPSDYNNDSLSKNEDRTLLFNNRTTIDADIDSIYSDQSKSHTEKMDLIKCRIGQGSFRRNLISMWGGCSVTGCMTHDILVASHIKPWCASSDNERLDPYNGLLLVAHLDKAFDSGLVSFDSKGLIMISGLFKEHALVGITPNLKVSLSDQHEKYLQYHRALVFKKK